MTLIVAAHDRAHGESCDCDIAIAIGDIEARSDLPEGLAALAALTEGATDATRD